jgi:bifunctional oligoribonuclease and PAP phosphatase NrnA
MLSQVVELIESRQHFCITSHANPDGDSLGSSLALYWILKNLRKTVQVVMRDNVPHSYRELPGSSDVIKSPLVPPGFDAVFVIECSDIDRPGLQDLDKQLVVNIDHHSTTALFGQINWIDSTASAVGEMIYNLCKALGVTINQQIAECIYTALLTDTGSFHYSNTTERTFKIASELVRRGVKPAHISQALFYSYPFSKIKVLGIVLSTLRRDVEGHIAWMSITLDAMHAAGATDEDLNGIVNYPLAVEEIEVVAFFKETASGVYRTSLRSKGQANVARVAEKFGGGGHRNAAGCTIKGEIDVIAAQVISYLQESLELVYTR